MNAAMPLGSLETENHPYAEEFRRAAARAKVEEDARTTKFLGLLIRNEDYPAIEEPIDWMVRSLMLAPGRPALIAGAGGVGKTYVVQAIALALQNGQSALGGLVQEGARRRVLHIDTDQGLRATRRRYRRLSVGMALPIKPSLLSLSDMATLEPKFNPTDVAHWRSIFKHFDLVIVDALSGLLAASDLDENKASDARSVMKAIMDASDAETCTVIIIAHTGKDVSDGKGGKVQQTDPRGSSAIKQAAGVVWSFTGEVARGEVRTATRTRDAADDDGDDGIVQDFQYKIEAAPVDVKGMLRRDGVPVRGLQVVRVLQSGRASGGREATLHALRVNILMAIRRGSIRSQRNLEGVVTGKVEDIRKTWRELVSEQVVKKGDDGFWFEHFDDEDGVVPSDEVAS